MRVQFLLIPALLSTGVAAPALATEAARPFSASRDPATFERSLQCLTEAIYYEARSESDAGQRAVAQVVLNRVRHPSYPSSVCGVVYQGSHRTTGCQFTFTCDGSIGAGVQPYAWARAREIAESALRGSVYRPVGLALNYHTTAIRPYWAPSLVPQTTVGAHIFYRRPGDGGGAGAFTQTPTEDDASSAMQPRYAVARVETRRVLRPTRDRYAPTPVLEIPVEARPVRYRTLGTHQTASASTPRQVQQRTVAVSTGPRLTRQGGIRIVRGGGASN